MSQLFTRLRPRVQGFCICNSKVLPFAAFVVDQSSGLLWLRLASLDERVAGDGHDVVAPNLKLRGAKCFIFFNCLNLS